MVNLSHSTRQEVGEFVPTSVVNCTCNIFEMGTTMNFLHRLRQHLTGRLPQSTVGPERRRSATRTQTSARHRLRSTRSSASMGSGASLETLLEMNRVQGW